MYDCQQPQLMYEMHQAQSDNDYTEIKSIIKEKRNSGMGRVSTCYEIVSQ